MLGESKRDVFFALKALRASPGLALVAILTLALGIGANTTVFSVVNAILGFPLPLEEPHRTAFLYGENPSLGVSEGGLSVDDFLDLREQARSFEHLVGAREAAFNLLGTEEPVRVQALEVTPGFFQVMGDVLARGRPFHPREGRPGAQKVMVVSHPFWQQRLGGDPEVLGRTLTLDGEPYTVVGVTKEEFFFPDRQTDVWGVLPLESGATRRDERDLFAFGRLREGVDADVATNEVSLLAERLAQAHPATNRGWGGRVVTLPEALLDGSGLGVVLLYGSITFVLLIACVNVANLLLSRATVRQREMALRTALGASRWRLVRQLVTESLVLSLFGGAAGLLIGIWGMRLLRRMIGSDPNVGFLAESMVLDPSMLVHTAAITVLAGLLFGILPAIQASRTDPAGALQPSGRGGGGGSGGRLLRNLLVMGQVAFALALLGTTGSLVRAFAHIYGSDPGFEATRLLTLQIDLPPNEYPDSRQVNAFYRQLTDRLEGLAGVEEASVATRLPLTLLPGSVTAHIEVEGALQESDDETPNVIDVVVGADYFETMGIPLLRGRGLEERDREESRLVGVVSESTVRRFWPERGPLGQRFRLGGTEDGWIEVVGVVPDVQTNAHSMRTPSPSVPHVFLPHPQHPRRALFLLVRAREEPRDLIPQVRDAVRDVDPDQPVTRVRTMEEVIEEVDTQNVFLIRVLSSLSLLALVLAGVGIYGVISFAVNQRVREIGLRMALGARPSDVLLVVLRQGALLAGIGLLVGLGLAWGFVRLLAAELEGLDLGNASGPLTFVAVAVVLLLVANLASFVPARRAVHIDPWTALRE